MSSPDAVAAIAHDGGDRSTLPSLVDGRPFLALAALFACGPSSAPTETDAQSSTGQTDPLDSSGGDETASGLGTESGSASTGLTSSSADEGDTECGCPENVPIGLDEELAEGFTPAQAIAEMTMFTGEFTWPAYEGLPPTVVHFDISYAGGAIEQGPGGHDPCAGGLWVPCEEGVIVDVEVLLTTDDGLLSWIGPGQLSGVLGDELLAYSNGCWPLADNAGTLAEHMPMYDGASFPFSTVCLFVEKEAQEDSIVSIFTSTPRGIEVTLGWTF